MKRIHDSKIKNRVFNVDDQVLLFNSRLKIFSGKLKSYWSGPFTIAKVFPYGTIELSQANGPNFKVNGHRIKHYFGGDVPQLSPVIHQPPQELRIPEMEDLKQQYLDELQCLSNLEYRDEIKIAELKENFNGMSIEIQKKEKLLQEAQWAYLSTHRSKRLISFYFDDDDDEDYTSAIIPDEPVFSTEEPNNSLSMGDEHLDTIPVTKSDEFIKSGVENLIPILSESEGIPEHMCDVPSHDNSPPLDVSKYQIEDFSESNKDFSSIDDDSFSIDDIDYVEASPSDPELVSSKVMEIVIPEVGGIDDDILLTINHDDLREKLRNVNLLISKIEALNANPTPSFDCNTNGSTTARPDISLPKYEAFYDDHVKEISSGSPITSSDISLSEYDSFIFDLSISLFPLTNRSYSYEFTDELIPFISAPEYDCFRLTVEPNSRDFTMDVVENISPTKEPQVLTILPTHPTLQLNMKFQHSSESLFAYVVWIFLPFLVYSVVPCYLLSLRNEDIIFDPGICKYHFSKPDISHRCVTVKKFNTHRSHLNKCPMMINGKNTPPLDVLLFYFYPP
nr:reverse transcriptase domain-containing protein [Tanacetum cinerariifolium]